MFTKIMIPVDLAHVEKLQKAVACAAELAKAYGGDVVMVGVTQSAPTEIAPTPETFAEKLSGYAADRSAALGVTFGAHTETSHDIAIDLDAALARAAEALQADLIVMASHAPGLTEYLFASNAGHMAAHAPQSVFVVR